MMRQRHGLKNILRYPSEILEELEKDSSLSPPDPSKSPPPTTKAARTSVCNLRFWAASIECIKDNFPSSLSSLPKKFPTMEFTPSYGAASSTSAGGSRSYRGKPGRGVNPTDKERRSSRGADRTSPKVNDEDEANSPKRKRARRKGKGAEKKGECILPTIPLKSPESFNDVWPHFVASAALMVTAVGLVSFLLFKLAYGSIFMHTNCLGEIHSVFV